MRSRIPMVQINNNPFKDVFEYLDKMNEAKAKQAQFNQTKAMEQARLDELAKYHQGTLDQNAQLNPLKLELLRTKIEALKNPKLSGKETPQEREDREVRTEDRKDKLKIKNKSLADLEKEAAIIKARMQNAVEASQIFEKNNGKSITNPIAAAQVALGYGDENSAALKPIFGKMQADRAKDFSTRGSVYGTKLAENQKPNLRYLDKQNLSILNEIHKDYYSRYKQIKEDYKRISGGKELPISEHDFYKKVKVISPKGGVYIKTPEEAERLIKKYPGTKIQGSAYE